MNNYKTTTWKTHSIYFLEKGKGPTLIFFHGYPFQAGLWTGVMDAFSEYFHCIAIDFTKTLSNISSQKPDAMKDYAEMTSAVMDSTSAERAHLIGHSMGGYIALETCSTYPEKVEALSLVHSVASADSEEMQHKRQKSIDLIKKGGKISLLNEMIGNLFTEKFRKNQAAVIDGLKAESAQLDDEVLIAFTTAMKNRKEHLDTIANAEIPIQWILGEEDALMPKEKILNQAILCLRPEISILKNVGHMGMLEDFKELVFKLKKFVNYASNS